MKIKKKNNNNKQKYRKDSKTKTWLQYINPENRIYFNMMDGQNDNRFYSFCSFCVFFAASFCCCCCCCYYFRCIATSVYDICYAAIIFFLKEKNFQLSSMLLLFSIIISFSFVVVVRLPVW